MGSFNDLDSLVDKLKGEGLPPLMDDIHIIKAANDNNGVDLSPAVESFKDALSSFVNKDQVRQLVVNEMHKLHCNNNITLLKDGEAIQLPEGLRHYLFPKILQTVNVGLPTALIGPAGSGKSTVCEQVAEALKLRFLLQNGVTGTHELTGYLDAHGRYNTTPFRDAFENGGLILVDEVDTSEAGALKWINTALANGHAGFPDKSEPVLRHVNFRILIAANTYGTGADRVYVGANQLDASTLDRFVFFNFNYDETLEKLVAGNTHWTEHVQQLRKNADTVHARIVISPRASINGAKLLSAGWKVSEVEDAIIWKGIDPELKKRIISPPKDEEEDKKIKVKLGR